jgi:O-antigen/teichoic acid export membrane protein
MIFGLPLLTRLYTPNDFSILAIYVSLLGIISVAACLRMEVAIPVPESDVDAANLLALSLFFGTFTAAIIALLVIIVPDKIVNLAGKPELRPYLWLFPVGILSSSYYNALQYWTTRKKAFSAVATTRMTQALGGLGTQLALGWAKISPLGLLLGQMISTGSGFMGLGRRAVKCEFEALKSVKIKDMRRLFHLYDQYPKFSTLEALANTAGIQLPIVIIGGLAIGPEAGFLMLAMKVMQIPLTLVGRSIAQVFLASAAEHHRTGTLGHFTGATIEKLFKIGVGPLIFACIVAPQVFILVFGEEWRRAGELVVWMTPWFIMQFISSPISMVMLVKNRHKCFLILTFSGLICRIGAIFLAVWINLQWLSEFYAVSGAVFYSICFFTFSYISEIKVKSLFYDIIKCSKIILVWGLFGFIFREILGIMSAI